MTCRDRIRATYTLLVLVLVNLPCRGQEANARVWPAGGMEGPQEFPEANILETIGDQGASNGICLTGGGTRSYTSAIGWFRALNQLKLLHRVKYLSSVSGGSWGAAAFYFRPNFKDADTFLGPYLTPDQLDMATISEMPPNNTMSFAVPSVNLDKETVATQYASVMLTTLKIFYKAKESKEDRDEALNILKNMQQNIPQPSRVWERAVHALFLDRLGISERAFLAQNNMTVADIMARNPGLFAKDSFVLPTDDQLPFLIMGATVAGPDTLAPLVPNTKRNSLTALEITPLYSGVPFAQNVVFESQNGDQNVGNSNEQVVDLGGFVETFAFGGKVDFTTATGDRINTSIPSNGALNSTINLFLSESRLTVGAGAGISSMAPGVAMAAASNQTLTVDPEIEPFLQYLHDFVPKANMWPWPGVGPNEKSAKGQRDMLLADGGSLDNSGVISLLRRNVKNLLVLDCSADPIDQNGNLQPLFGINLTSSSNLNLVYGFSHNQVFNSSDYDSFINQMVTASETGSAAIATATLTTVENSWWGIPAGNVLNLTWVNFNAPLDWLESLPTDTQNDLQEGINGSLANFPRFGTQSQFLLSAPQTNLLSQLTSYIILENNMTIMNALGLAPPPTKAPETVVTLKPSFALYAASTVVGLVLLLLLIILVRFLVKKKDGIDEYESEEMQELQDEEEIDDSYAAS
eukprot:m.26625 g.26625  ORF g.26625 m.26625 type:complete len:692 (-) comp7816_c0_seq1:193-2268(-)